MDHLWTPWRYQYVRTASPKDACLFCRVKAEQRDRENFVVHRATFNFVMLNRYPYTVGHLMIAPYEHVALLEAASKDTLIEMMLLAQKAQACLGAIYRPGGFNLGMNLGEVAGAGVAGHIHMHVLPRWAGDAGFMTAVGETRVMSEELPVTYGKLADAFKDGSTALQ